MRATSWLLKAALLAGATFSATNAAASELDNPETARCIGVAADRFGVSETALWLILDVERGTVGRVSQNTNATVDIGPMQINSWWLKHLERFGISREDILYDRCMNIYAAAWIYAQEYAREGDVVRAIARYHSPTPHHQHRYLGLVQQAIARRAKRLNQQSERAPQPRPVQAVSQAFALGAGDSEPSSARARQSIASTAGTRSPE